MIVAPAADRAAACARLEAAARHDVLGMRPAVADLVGDYPLWDVLTEGGQAVGAIAAAVHLFTDCAVVRCSAAACEPGHDATAALDAFLQRLAHQAGAAVITCETARPGLVRRLKARGWEVGGYILRRAAT